jgi:hypothetical protein
MATQQLLRDVIPHNGSTLRLRAPPAGGCRGHQGLLRRALARESLYAVSRLRAHGHRGALHDGGRRRRPRTRMLELLAAVAAAQGIHRFDTEVMADNRAMLGVFKGAGFAVRRTGASSEVTVSLDITPTDALTERIAERDHLAAVASLRPSSAPRAARSLGSPASGAS